MLALLVLLAADSLGAAVEHPWDAMVPAMAIGVTVGIRSPRSPISSSRNCSVQLALVLPVAAVVGVAWLLSRALDRFILWIGAVIPSDIYDEDT